MAGRLARALQVIPRDAAQLVDSLRGTRLQGAGDGGRLGTPRPPTGAWHRRIEAHRAMALGDGLGATEEPPQAIEDLLDGAIAHGLVGELHLFPHGSEETVPPSRRASGPQTGTSRGHRRLLVHGALLAARGHVLS